MAAEIYPKLTLDHIKDPNRLWAIPIFGGVVKIIFLIPVIIEILFLSLWAWGISMINSFYVLANSKYWDYSYTLNLGLFRLILKTSLFFVGLTNKYPGFDLKIDDKFSLGVTKPVNPNKFFAFPVLGFVARVILIIPFAIYTQIIKNGSRVGVVISSIPVLVNGKYPESTYELTRDSQRLGLAQSVYLIGLSDKYPNFQISMNHQTIKIALIIIGTLIAFGNFSRSQGNQNNIRNYQTPGITAPRQR